VSIQAPLELRLDGLVARPLVLRQADLTKLARVELTEPFTCEEGWQVQGLTWRGVRLAEVLGLVGRRLTRIGFR
jgi:DMSO/TMAO reductase YedYZ molybdopterin-dependent catalytic subunit